MGGVTVVGGSGCTVVGGAGGIVVGVSIGGAMTVEDGVIGEEDVVIELVGEEVADEEDGIIEEVLPVEEVADEEDDVMEGDIVEDGVGIEVDVLGVGGRQAPT